MTEGPGLALAAALGCIALLASADARAACRGRPTDPGRFEGLDLSGVEVKSFATAQARVHWATSGPHAPVLTSSRSDGVPDTVAFAAETAEAALTRYAAMGYRRIPSDAACPSNGGDEKVDIYLVSFPAADGSTVSECDGATCSSFALVESRFTTKAYGSPQEGFRTVIAHELFHAVHNTYTTDTAPFWAEGAAQWAMKTLHPDLQDFERALKSYFEDPTRSIDAPPSGVTAGFLYGSAVWPLFLSLRHGPDTVREILEAEGSGHEVLAATDAVLTAKNSSLADAFPMFAAWNASTGALAGDGGYPDAARYPGVRVGALEDGRSEVTSGLAYFAYRGTLEAAQQIALDTDAARNAGVLVPIEAGRAALSRAKRLPATAEGDVLVVVAGVTTKKTDAPFTIRFLPPETSSSGTSGGSGDDGCSSPPRPAPSGGALGFGCAGAAMLVALRRSRRR